MKPRRHPSYTVITNVVYAIALLYKRRRWATSRRLGWLRINYVIYRRICRVGRIQHVFVIGLTDLGYKPGKSITLMCQSREGHYDRLGAPERVLQGSVDVIVTTYQPAGMSARKITTTGPIGSHQRRSGRRRPRKSLGHPGMNVTGVTYYATELTAKRLELLRQMLPALQTVGILDNPAFTEVNPDLVSLPFKDDAEKAAQMLGLKTNVQSARQREDLEPL